MYSNHCAKCGISMTSWTIINGNACCDWCKPKQEVQTQCTVRLTTESYTPNFVKPTIYQDHGMIMTNTSESPNSANCFHGTYNDTYVRSLEAAHEHVKAEIEKLKAERDEYRDALKNSSIIRNKKLRNADHIEYLRQIQRIFELQDECFAKWEKK